RKTAQTLIGEQTREGGFVESHFVRPRSVRNVAAHARHVLATAKNPILFWERFRYFLALQRQVHSRIRTHWSDYSRQWNEANLFDSWFRLLALARIEVAHDEAAKRHWGFLSYPGIGFHPIARSAQV